MLHKRVFALILALTLCFSLAIVSFAEDDEDESALEADYDEQIEDVLLIVEEEFDGEEEPADEEEPVAEEEPADEEEPAAEAPVSEEDPAAEEEPVAEEKPVDEKNELIRLVIHLTPAETQITLYASIEYADISGETVYEVALYENGAPIVIDPEADGTYLVSPGVYLYDATCEGYKSIINGILTVELP